MDLKTPVGKKFLKLIDLHFPKGSILHPLINRNKVKLSYRCLPNMGSTISKHNKKILNNDQYVPRCQISCSAFGTLVAIAHLSVVAGMPWMSVGCPFL